MASQELSQRIITGSILGGLLLVLLLFAITSPIGVSILIAVLSLCALRIAWEVYILRRSPELTVAVLFPVLGVLLEIARVGIGSPLHVLAGGALVLSVIVTAGYVFSKFILAKNTVQEIAATLAPDILMVLFVGVPLSLIMALIASEGGAQYLLWTIVIVAVTDTAAYFGGKKFEGPKLAPVVSPGKTWSGLLAGVLGGTIVGSLWAIVALRPIGSASFIVLAAVLCFLAQASDLAKSYVKRLAGVKDTGQLLPGHGGLLDRVDGHLGAAALVTIVLMAYS